LQQITKHFRSLPFRAVPRPAAVWDAQLPSHRLFAPGLSDAEWLPRAPAKARPALRRKSVLVFLERVLCLN
jgi:hypothetical protein